MLFTTLVVSILVCCRWEVRCGLAGVVSGLQAKARLTINTHIDHHINTVYKQKYVKLHFGRTKFSEIFI